MFFGGAKATNAIFYKFFKSSRGVPKQLMLFFINFLNLVGGAKATNAISGGGPGGSVFAGGAAPGGRGRPPGSGVPPRCPRRGGLGPKMRHLVLYKLAGFPTADKVSLNGELC